jgi:hydrogenase nickel incorporation protein HypA/HybF
MERLQPRPKRLVKTRVVVGALRQVVPEHLRFAYETLSRGTVAEGSTLEIQMVPIVGRCEDCGREGLMPRAQFQCDACGSNRAAVVGGRELYVESLEVEYDEHDANTRIP